MGVIIPLYSVRYNCESKLEVVFSYNIFFLSHVAAANPEVLPQPGMATPPLDIATPPLDIATPPLDKATPPLDEATPPLDEATPPLDIVSRPLQQRRRV